MSTEELLYKSKYPTTADNYVGIEIEFLIPYSNQTNLQKMLLDKKLQWNLHLGNDGSVRDEDDDRLDDLFRPRVQRERYASKELRILATEAMAPDIINTVCSIIEECKGKVNDTCGLHVHLDMRNRDVEKVYNNFHKFQDLMFRMQPKSRRSNRFCKKMVALVKNPGDRYYAINKQAYNEHGTLEIRLHEGSINAADIRKWVFFLIKIADMQSTLTKTVKKIDDFKFPTNVKEYVNGRIEAFTG